MICLFVFLNFSLGFAQKESGFVQNHLVIKIKESNFKSKKIDLARNRFGITLLDKLNYELELKNIQPIGNYRKTKTFLLVFKNSINVKREIKKYKQLKQLEFVEPDFIGNGGGQKLTNPLLTPNDAYFSRQWGLVNNGTMTGIGAVTLDADVDIELAWNIQTGDPTMIIAVSDSGLKMNHPDIASRIWSNPLEIINGIDDDGNGYIDDINGWDWVNTDNNPTDDLGHGTNVAGIIGAIPNNGNLYAGVNWNSKIMPLKVLDSNNSSTYSSMASSIYYAVDNGAKIVSMSIGGNSTSAAFTDVINYANVNNVLLVFCMMNTNTNVTYYPAGYSTTYSNVIAVGSTNPDDKRSAPFFWSATSGSNYGNHINVVAPGNYIYGLDYSNNTYAGSYWGGTSQATPLVAGIASLLLSQNPALTPSQIRSIIQNTAQDQVGNPSEDSVGFDQYMGYGRVNAYAALQATLGIPQVNSNPSFQIVNPIKNGELQIKCLENFSGHYLVTIYSMDGKLIFTKMLDFTTGLNTIEFNYPKGNYIFSLKNDIYAKNFKILN